VPTQPLSSLPALGLCCGANENALCGALVVVATVAMATTMAIMVVVVTAMQEVALLMKLALGDHHYSYDTAFVSCGNRPW